METRDVRKVTVEKKFNLIHTYWDPKIAGRLNGQLVKLVKFKGEFTWHTHENEDEMFLVMAGKLCIELRDKKIDLEHGEFVIIPKGIEHKPVAKEEVQVLLFEPESTLNTGNVENHFTKPEIGTI